MKRCALSIGHAVEVIVPGEPATKGRPRFTRTGRTYTPQDTKDAEEQFVWAVRSAYPGIQPDATGQFRIWARFYQSTFHRRDLDNMIKLVADACNGVIWVDDMQVRSIDAEVVRGEAKARSHVIFTKIAETDDYPTAHCQQCGASFRLYPSWPLRSACSATCAARLRNVTDLSAEVACAQCQRPFRRQTSSQRMCSEACRRESMRGRNRRDTAPNHCRDCGCVTPNRRAQRCRMCWRNSLTKAEPHVAVIVEPEMGGVS